MVIDSGQTFQICVVSISLNLTPEEEHTSTFHYTCFNSGKSNHVT